MTEEGKYKYEVPAEVFVEAVTTTKWTKEYAGDLNKFGIERLLGKELKKQTVELNELHYEDNEIYTLLSNIEVLDEIIIESKSGYIPNLVFYGCKLSNIRLKNCKWKDDDVLNSSKKLVTRFNIISSIIRDLKIEDSFIGDFNILSSTTIGDFRIWGNNILGNFRISNSNTGLFSIFNNSTVGNFRINNSVVGNFNLYNSNVGYFHIWGKSVTGYLRSYHNKVGDFRVEDSDFGDFTFEKSITGSFFINSSRVKDLTIWRDSKIKNFNINSSSIFSFQIEHSIIGNFNIVKSELRNLWVKAKCIVSDVAIRSSTIKRIKMLKNSISGSFYIWENSSIEYFNVEESVTSGFRIYDSKISTLLVEKSISTFLFSKVNINQCKILYCYVHQLRIQSGSVVELYLQSNKINYINFNDSSLGKNSLILFSNIQVYVCIMNRFIVLGNLFFNRIKSSENFFSPEMYDEMLNSIFPFSIHDHKKYELVNDNLASKKLNYLKKCDILLDKFPESAFQISQSSMGKSEFTECMLGKFRKFEYNNSKLTEIFISGGTIPNKINVPGKANSIKTLKQQKSFFDQLRKVFEGQGDIVRSTEYHAKASEVQMRIIEAKKGKLKYFNTEWWVYKLNEASNRHGESWGWAVVFTLGISLMGFIFYNHALNNIKYEFVHEWNTDWLGDWAQFILPTHKMEFMDENPSSSAKFIDVLFRILIGYGIYQLISAFRKHGKKV